MRRIALALLLGVSAGGTPAQAAPPKPPASAPYKNPKLPVAARVKDLLGRMTLEEKVAQLEAVWERKKDLCDEQNAFAPAKAGALLGLGVGHVGQGNAKRKARDAVVFLNALQKYLREETRLGIPALVHEEGLHGFSAPGATSYPQAIALAATFDPALVERVFTATALEMRSRGAHQALTPVLDVARDPRWGRTEETYGEDPFLAAAIGKAAIFGFQGREVSRDPMRGKPIDRDHVIATTKHFAGHGEPVGGRNTAPASTGLRTLREVVFPSFAAAIREAGAWSVMASYNEIDGVPSHGNRWLLGDVLRREWGFAGTVVSDYFGIAELATRHAVASDPAGAAQRALEAGVDVELPDPDTYQTLAASVRAGRIKAKLVDDAVRRVLAQKLALGLFEDPFVDPARAESLANASAHRALAAEAARRAIVLLENKGDLLPLALGRIKTIAVIGPNAGTCQLGGYTSSPGPDASALVSILDGIRKKVAGRAEVLFAHGCDITTGGRGFYDDVVELAPPAKNRADIVAAVAVAKRADVVVLAIGQNAQVSREAWSEKHLGDRDDLGLVGAQADLARAVLATGKPVVVVLIHGSPLAIPEIARRAPAILDGFYLGQETGTAVADVLFGDAQPAGRLPISVPASVGQLPVYYDKKRTAERSYLFGGSGAPLWAFGHGLTYAKFVHGAPRLDRTSMRAGEHATVSVEVTNTSGFAADEVVELYVRDDVSSVTRPARELRGFARVTLAAGERRTVSFALGPAELSLVVDGTSGRRVVEPGTFTIFTGPRPDALQAAKLTVTAR